MNSQINAVYRLQLGPSLTFLKVQEILPYLQELGFSHLYFSPIWQAKKGSTHGYDIVNYNQISLELGGEEQFWQLLLALEKRNMQVILDFVPNHMAISHQNPWWWDVLLRGTDSSYFSFFDIELDTHLQTQGAEEENLTQQKIIIPILAKPLEECYRQGDFTFELSGPIPYLIYGEHIFPLPVPKELVGTDLETLQKNDLFSLLKMAPYQLTYFRQGIRKINFRRFFDISELIGLRVEENHVFESVHNKLAEILKSPVICGVRVDHLDGLYDPWSYLQNLAGIMPRNNQNIWVEKILLMGESLPPDFLVRGSTGYDFLMSMQTLFVCPIGYRDICRQYYLYTGSNPPENSEEKNYWNKLYFIKLEIIEEYFHADFVRIQKYLQDFLDEEWDPSLILLASLPHQLIDFLKKITASMRIYRTYWKPHRPLDPLPALAKRTLFEWREISWSLNFAREQEELSKTRCSWSEKSYQFWKQFFKQMFKSDSYSPKSCQLLLKWQQLTGAIFAKGQEDTWFYQFVPLISQNEVGAPPVPPINSIVNFHILNVEHAKHFPQTFLATSTHDSKRAEDARALLNILSEIPTLWDEKLVLWQRMNAHLRYSLKPQFPSIQCEILLYQTLLSTLPNDFHQNFSTVYCQRILSFMLKAAREAKIETNWHSPNLIYEEIMMTFVNKVLQQKDFLTDLKAFHCLLRPFSLHNSLTQLALKVLCPGIPDFYQGSEIWNDRLVDPDNRTPINFSLLQEKWIELSHLRGKFNGDRISFLSLLLKNQNYDHIKMFFTQELLHLRSKEETFFINADYTPLIPEGKRAKNIIAFIRHNKNNWLLVICSRFLLNQKDFTWPLDRTFWDETYIRLPPSAPRSWINLLTALPCNEMEVDLPVKAMLEFFPIGIFYHDSL